MCGIFGIAFQQTSIVPDEERLRMSARALTHRGPDAHDIHAGPGIGLAHTRLSFLDVDPRSNQPFWDEQRRYCLVYNGEIYNFRELRAELEARGVAFRTTGDTEVLLQALINDAPESVLSRLRGMFAFGLYDSQEGTLLLARDRFGMKPLYVHEGGGHFMFASEIKAMRQWADLDLDRFSISSYLLKAGGPMKGFTFFQGVKSVTPGGMVRYHADGTVEHGTFFALPDFIDPETMGELAAASEQQIVDRMDELLLNSVNSHMFADVPVGAFCSGGVDSSLLMAMAARSYSDLAIFHANVKGQWSEQHAAVALSKHLKLDLKAVDVEEQDFVDMLPRVMAHYEHPYTYHPNCAPLMMVALLARENGVKGLLSGEGSDECFLGYPWLGRKRLMDAYYGFGRKLRSLVHRVPEVGKLAWPYEGETLDTVRALLNRREVRDDEQATQAAIEKLGLGKSGSHTAWSLDYMHYHLRSLLHRNDTMGMAASIEARFPFLDHDVVKMAVNLPAKYKLKVSPFVFERAHPFIRDKWVVRKVADRYVPRDLSQRTKLGFWTTVFQRLQISERYFEKSYVRDLFELSVPQMNDLLDEADQDLKMRLLHLDVWGRTCVEGRPQDMSVASLREHTSISPE